MLNGRHIEDMKATVLVSQLLKQISQIELIYQAIQKNTNTALIMFAVIAAFGVVAATLVVPIVPQAYAQGRPSGVPPCDRQSCATDHPTGAPISPPGRT
jgi:hypothetical protein